MTILNTIRTVDDLLLALTALGYHKEPTVEPALVRDRLVYNTPMPSHGLFWRSSDNAMLIHCGSRYINIHPALGDENGDLFVQVHHDAEGNLLHDQWCMAESYAGSAVELDPSVIRLDDLGDALVAWMESWSRERA